MESRSKAPKAIAARHTTKALREIIQGYRALLESALREEGLTLPQLRLLHAVQERTGVSAAAIARLCQITPQTLQAMLSRAVREGWIVRGTSERNHRILTASLTSQGRALLERGEAMAADIERKLWTGVTAEALQGMNDILSRGLLNLHAEIARHAAESTE